MKYLTFSGYMMLIGIIINIVLFLTGYHLIAIAYLIVIIIFILMGSSEGFFK